MRFLFCFIAKQDRADQDRQRVANVIIDNIRPHMSTTIILPRSSFPSFLVLPLILQRLRNRSDWDWALLYTDKQIYKYIYLYIDTHGDGEERTLHFWQEILQFLIRGVFWQWKNRLMIHLSLDSISGIFKDAAGVAGPLSVSLSVSFSLSVCLSVVQCNASSGSTHP